MSLTDLITVVLTIPGAVGSVLSIIQIISTKLKKAESEKEKPDGPTSNKSEPASEKIPDPSAKD